MRLINKKEDAQSYRKLFYMIIQHEFWSFAYSQRCDISAWLPTYKVRRNSITEFSRSTYLLIEHLRLPTQIITLRHQRIDLLSPLQHALDRLMQDNLRLVQLLLDLHDTVRLLRVLVFHNVFFEGREREGLRVRRGVGSSGVAGQKLVDDFGEELMGDEGGVILVADYYSGDAFGAAIGVECVGWWEKSGGSFRGGSWNGP